MADESQITLKSLNCFTDFFQGRTYPGHMLIRFSCDSWSRLYVVRLKIGDSTVCLYN